MQSFGVEIRAEWQMFLVISMLSILIIQDVNILKLLKLWIFICFSPLVRHSARMSLWHSGLCLVDQAILRSDTSFHVARITQFAALR